MGYPDVQYNRSSRDTSTNTCLIRARARTQALPAVGSETCFGITSQDKKIVTVLGYQITRPSLRISESRRTRLRDSRSDSLKMPGAHRHTSDGMPLPWPQPVTRPDIHSPAPRSSNKF